MTMTFEDLEACMARQPRARLAHLPTPLEAMPNLCAQTGAAALYVKRDDCTGLAFGGNKVRQLEFYFGQAQAEGADTVLITGAVQSNFVRLAAASANHLGMACHIQLEERVPKSEPTYRASGNVLLDRLLGATLHSYPDGEDEAGADARIHEIADDLKRAGKRPYVIPLAPGHAPYGALGYVDAALETARQAEAMGVAIDEVVVGSGSGHTHAGLLFGLRALGIPAQVTGICVRRDATTQQRRIATRCREIADLLEIENPVIEEKDIQLSDATLAPGYGRLNPATLDAIGEAARHEGLLLDPVYSGKVMAGLLAHAREAGEGRSLLFIHTGGTPALFAYEPELTEAFSQAAE